MINESTNLSMEIKIPNGDVQITVGFFNASIDKDGNNLCFSINLINKQLITDNLTIVKQQYSDFYKIIIEKAVISGINFMSN